MHSMQALTGSHENLKDCPASVAVHLKSGAEVDREATMVETEGLPPPRSRIRNLIHVLIIFLLRDYTII